MDAIKQNPEYLKAILVFPRPRDIMGCAVGLDWYSKLHMLLVIQTLCYPSDSSYNLLQNLFGRGDFKTALKKLRSRDLRDQFLRLETETETE